MEAFIRIDQYNFIKQQVENIVNGYATSNDINVRKALKALASDKVFHKFENIQSEYRSLLYRINEVENPAQRDRFLSDLKPYVIEFSRLSEQGIKKLFPKAKKLKVPDLNKIDWSSISYLAWNDKGASKYYLIVPVQQKLIGIQGTLSPVTQKGVCTICNRHGNVSMFLSETKGAIQGTYTKRGNYICTDYQKCNNQITSLSKLEAFVELVMKK
ncbi:FusB/FusC family EF-G-binding protein [Pseudoneobacillus sp. C159]